MAQKKAAAAAKKPAAQNKRGPKAKQVVEEKPKKEVEPSDDESDEEQNGVNFDDGSDSEAEDAGNLIDSEAEEAEDDEEEDDEEDDDDEEAEDEDEVEPGEVSKTKVEADDSDDEPAEAPIDKDSKESKTPGGIPRIRIGKIPPTTPKKQIIFVSHLPEKYKHVELVALFAKFGQIGVVNRVKTKAGGNNILISFESAEAVEAILAAKPKALTLNDQVLNVSRPLDKKDLNKRTVVVGLLGPSTSKEQVTEHFKECGTIESVNFSNNRALPTAFVRFESVDSVAKAVELNGSQLNSRYITVREELDKSKTLRSPDLTLLVTNTGNYESYQTEVVERIFKKYGEVIDIDVVCTKSVLGFVTYKTSEEAQKAIKELNGKTIDGLEIKLQKYSYNSSARTVLVTNLANDVDDSHLESLFSDSGDIESIKIFGHKALVKFTTDDGFCKAFLNNERFLLGQPIFLEPNSLIKHKLLQKKNAAKGVNPRQHTAPGQFQKFGNRNKPFNSNNNNRNNNNKRPFNKRPGQNNGSAQPFKKSRKV